MSTVDNSNNSHLLAVFNLLALVIGIGICVIFSAWPSWEIQTLAVTLTAISAFINFSVKAETGDAWKAWMGWIIVLITIALYIWPVSVNSIK